VSSPIRSCKGFHNNRTRSRSRRVCRTTFQSGSVLRTLSSDSGNPSGSCTSFARMASASKRIFDAPRTSASRCPSSCSPADEPSGLSLLCCCFFRFEPPVELRSFVRLRPFDRFTHHGISHETRPQCVG
jgi:hypothetical protein